MRKFIIVAGIATLALGAATVAFGGSSERRIASTPTAKSNPVQKELSEVNRRLIQSKAARVNCRSVDCVNRTLTKLSKAVKKLNRDAFKCEQLVPVTSYSGYLYTPDGGASVFETSALDYTESGDTPSNQVVVYTC